MTEKVKTIEDYLMDVESHKRRIKAAEAKLAALPVYAYNWQEQRKIDETRNGLLNEIRVLKQRIHRATALEDE